MGALKVKLTLAEQIDRAKDGRSQRWMIQKLSEAGHEMSDTVFSNKKNGSDVFSSEELKVLSEILGTAIEA